MVLLAGFVVFYGWNDPETTDLFPGCPFKKLTGLDCPGCGSQRAIHNLLNLNLSTAFFYNPLMVISIPYILGGLWFDFRKNLSPRQQVRRRRLYGTRAIWTVFTVIILYTFIRNIV